MWPFIIPKDMAKNGNEEERKNDWFFYQTKRKITTETEIKEANI